MPYTEEEELWLQHQYKLLDEAFMSVSLGEELVKVRSCKLARLASTQCRDFSL